MRYPSLSGVNEAQLREALDRLQLAIVHEAKYVERRAVYFSLDLDDLHAIARMAVMEAMQTFEEGRGRHFDSWARQMIRWRLREAVAGEIREVLLPCEEPEANERADARLEALEEAWLVARAQEDLKPRTRRVLASRAQGVKVEQIAEELGLHHSTIVRDLNEAKRTLQRAVLGS